MLSNKFHKHKKLLLVLAVIGALAAAALLVVYKMYHDTFTAITQEIGRSVQDFLAYVQAAGIWGPVLLLPAWLVASFATGFTLLTLASGLLYGPIWGFFIVWVEAMIGGSVVFLVARRFFHAWLTQKVATMDPALRAIYEALEENNFKLLFCIRLSPFMPFAPFTLLFSLSPISFPSFFGATAIGLVPRIIMTVLAGSAFKSLIELFSGEGESKGAFFIFLGLGATGVLLIVIALTVQRAMAKMLSESAALRAKV
eukprot:TRINITY_DN16925_c0_g1_i1.p1 TRINITY_DN16925_c0_g1~~TRINITY_DN16925_c0_g1_i1.p1  ORF type:complete len:271 (+),score=77.02 TRINITY_DN16925_c0_g1_i1:50-814(+)